MSERPRDRATVEARVFNTPKAPPPSLSLQDPARPPLREPERPTNQNTNYHCKRRGPSVQRLRAPTRNLHHPTHTQQRTPKAQRSCHIRAPSVQRFPAPPPPRVGEPDSPTNRLAAAKTPGCSKPAHERASVPMRSVRLLICTTTQPSRAKGGSAPGQVHTPKRRRALGAVGDAVTKRGRLAMWFSVGTAGCSGQPWLILPGFCWGAVAKRAPLRCGGAHRLKGWLAHSRVLEGLAQALPPVKQRPNYTSSDSPAGTLAAAKTGPCRDIRGQQREGIRQGACVRLGRPSAGRSRRPGQQTTGERGG